VKIARTRSARRAPTSRNAALGAHDAALATGADEAGAALERLLAADRVQTSFHATRRCRPPSSCGHRAQQQLLRIDFETAPSHEVLATKLAEYDRLLADRLVILSDYGKAGSRTSPP